ncbi:MAG: hypothetical protein ACXV5H_10095, partial [Halobacteriota archaeon]
TRLQTRIIVSCHILFFISCCYKGAVIDTLRAKVVTRAPSAADLALRRAWKAGWVTIKLPIHEKMRSHPLSVSATFSYRDTDLRAHKISIQTRSRHLPALLLGSRASSGSEPVPKPQSMRPL